MIASFLFAFSSSLLVFALASLLVGGGLVYYALWRKGDVCTEFSYGKTLFRLEAKESKAAREQVRAHGPE